MDGEGSAEELVDILALGPFIPSLHTHLIEITSRTLETTRTRNEIEAEYEEKQLGSFGRVSMSSPR